MDGRGGNNRALFLERRAGRSVSVHQSTGRLSTPGGGEPGDSLSVRCGQPLSLGGVRLCHRIVTAIDTCHLVVIAKLGAF